MVIKLKGYTYKITPIVAANIPRLPFSLNLRHFTLLNSNYVKLSIF